MTDRDSEGSPESSRRTFMKATGAATAAAAVGTGEAAAAEHSIDDLLADMSVGDKAGQMIQPALGSLDPSADAPGVFDVDTVGELFSTLGAGSVLAGGANPPTVDPEELVTQINALQEFNLQNSDHEIPFFFGIDGVHGACYVDGGTMLPQRLNMGATRDVDLIEQAEQHTADMIAATGCHETFAPTVELQRDPRWGRYFEGISEDPKLLGDVSLARRRALESNDRVTSTVKHFAGYEAPRNGNDRAAAQTPMRDLRETLLPPFRVALEEGARMVMVNSGSVNGVPAHASHWLLTEMLREEYGFEGVTLTDWNDLYRMIALHDYHPDTREDKKAATRDAIAAGVDMVMLGSSNENSVKPGQFVTFVEELVVDGELSEERIDESVRRILQLKEDLGLFEDPYADESKVASLVGNSESLSMATDLARESMVMLKNEPVTENGDPVLPLSGAENVLVTGPGVDPETGIENRILMQHGGWTIGWQGIEACSLSEGGPRPAGSTMIEELESALGGDQVTHVPTDFEKSQWYASEDSASENGDYGFTESQRNAVESAAPDADAAVVVLGEGPHNEGFGDRDTLALPETQREILRTVVENTSDDTPVVGVEYAGSPRGGQQTFQHLDALVYAGQPGSGGGRAIVDVLTGAYNPSGRLGFTWPQQTGHVPVYHNARASNQPEPLYSFGHGLSYTDLEYANFSVRPSSVDRPDGDQSVQATVDVRNSGDAAGDHIVEIHNTASYGSVMHRAPRVVGYERVEGLEPGESRTVEVDIDLAALEVVPGDVPAFGPKAVEAGDYEMSVGEQTATLTIRNSGNVSNSGHVPRRFDMDGDGTVTIFDVLDIYNTTKPSD